MRREKGIFRAKDGTLRAGWLLALGAVVTTGLVRVGQSAATLAAGAMLLPFAIQGNGASLQSALASIARWAGAIALGAGAWVSWHYFTKRPMAQMGLRAEKTCINRLCAGAVQGIGAAVAVFGILLAAAQVRVEVLLPVFRQTVVERAAFYGLAAVAEGMFYQGFCLHAAKGTGKSATRAFWAVLIAAALYAAGHMAAGMPIWWYLNSFLFGALLAVMTLVTGDIWTAVGAHWLWNMVWGPMLGFAADGIRAQGLWQAQYTAATMWNGGPLGPQSGAVASGMMLAWLAVWIVRVSLSDKGLQ